MHFLKSDFVEYLHYETRLKLKQATTHLQVKSWQAVFGKERTGLMYCPIHCCKHLPNNNYLLLDKAPLCVFSAFFKELTAKCFHLHLQYEYLSLGKGRSQGNLYSIEGECSWLCWK